MIRKNTFRKIIIILSVLLIIAELIYADFKNCDLGFWLRIFSGVLIIIAMSLGLRQAKRGNLKWL